MYQDYQQHPEKYQLTAHGLISRDPLQQNALMLGNSEKILRLKNLMLRNKKLENPTGVTQGVDFYRNVAGAPGAGATEASDGEPSDQEIRDLEDQANDRADEAAGVGAVPQVGPPTF